MSFCSIFVRSFRSPFISANIGNSKSFRKAESIVSAFQFYSIAVVCSWNGEPSDYVFTVWQAGILWEFRGFIFSIISLIPLIIYCITNRNYLPETCASHFDIHFQPDGYMSKVFVSSNGLTLGFLLLVFLVVPCWYDGTIWYNCLFVFACFRIICSFYSLYSPLSL